jgi:cell division protein FtsZ
MGVGAAKGQDKAVLASTAAISSPLLETSITGATGVLVCITASENVTLQEVELASRHIHEEAHPDANIIWGATFDPTLEDEIRVTIIATGFDKMKAAELADAKAARVEANAEAAVEETASEPVMQTAIPQSNVEDAFKAFTAAPEQEAVAEAPAAPYTPAVEAAAPQVVVTEAPAPEKSSYQKYDEIFTTIKKIKKG